MYIRTSTHTYIHKTLHIYLHTSIYALITLRIVSHNHLVCYVEKKLVVNLEEAQRAVGVETGGDITRYFCDATVAEKVLTMLAMFFFTTYTPFMRIEDNFLKAAFSLRGVVVPSRRTLVTKYLPACYESEHAKFRKELASYNGPYQVATDGWKKRAADKGVPLVNFMILFPNTRPRQWSVISAEGEIKNAQWIAETCLNIHDDIQAAMGSGARCSGFIMDNTRANRNAMALMEAAQPQMCCIGCAAHALSLLMKDYGKRFPWLGHVYDTCILITNLISSSEAMRFALHKCMKGIYNVVRSISTHVETRFGSKHIVMRDVMKKYESIKA